MKILWVVGITIPQASELLGHAKIPFGGWVSQMIELLSKNDKFEIGVAMKSNVERLIVKKNKGVTYYYLPINSKNKFDIYTNDCLEVLSDFKPDLMHCEGTEQKFTNTFLNNWEGKNVVSLQGVINGYEPYEYGEINPFRLIASWKLRHIVLGALMILNKHLKFKPRLKIERDTIAKAQNILGRTIWDRSNSYFFNRKANYYVCRRILRPLFYNNTWQFSQCQRFSVFLGNSAQLRKGAHFVIEAIELLKVEYPQIKLYIAGEHYNNSIKDWKSYFGYRGFLHDKIKKSNLENQVEFLGVLQEKKMMEAMKLSNVYVMSSIIENSPNTLGEAMIMGMPCVASFNGGVSEMAADETEALLYRSNDPKMLAYQIKRLFENPNMAVSIGEQARIKAQLTHNPVSNLNDLIQCYNSILNE